MGKRATSLGGLLDRLFGIDLRSVAFLRIGIGLFLLFDLADRSRWLREHYTDDGFFPRTACVELWSNGLPLERLWAFSSFHMISGELGWQVFLFVLNACFALALLVGYRSRLSAFLCWVMLVSLHNRNPFVLHGGDEMIRHTVFWSLFLPLGARFSLDGLCAVCKAYQQPVPTRTLSLATAGILLQTVLLYWFTAALKSGPEWRTDGTALYYALSIDHYEKPLGHLMLGMPLIVLKLMTWAALLMEAFGAFFAYIPVATERWRLGTALAFWTFHLVLISGLIDVGPISETSCLIWIPYLPALFWDRLALLWQRLPSVPAKRWLEAHYQRLVAWRNQRIVARVKKGEPLPELRPTKITQLVALGAIIFSLFWNLRTEDPKRYGHYTQNFNWLANLVRLDQHWGMFAPYPFKDDGWNILAVELEDGSQIDLLHGGKPVSLAKPPVVRDMYTNERDRKYLMNLYLPSNSAQRPHFLHGMLRQWQRQNPDKAIKRAALYYMLQRTPPPGQPEPAPKQVLLFSETYTKV